MIHTGLCNGIELHIDLMFYVLDHILLMSVIVRVLLLFHLDIVNPCGNFLLLTVG